ncbi:c-type cytochrome [Gluconobacter morbifer]|uniref:Putative cytochrome c-552 n=1 Tax=Gluconobacter morbifer G707 TaxID=1088869 RepID=G6XFA8_9PROT|nr:cytochrome c [Gluconobacter morbifer]EHH68866.1 putative cytochrome c-552 [Gluconobacter morbifer G707]
MMKSALFLTIFCLSATSALAASDGKALYTGKCAVCHQAGGMGSPGQFPPLRERVGKIAASPEGRAYLATVLVNGLHGPLTAAGSHYAGFMPSFGSVSDEDIAAVLTYVASLGSRKDAPAISVDDVKAARATPKKAKEILSQRQALEAEHPLP